MAYGPFSRAAPFATGCGSPSERTLAQPSVDDFERGIYTSGLARSRLPGRVDRRPHHGVVLALGSHVAETGLFEQAAGHAVEERRRDLLAAGVLGIGLHHAAASLGDQVQRALERQGRDAAAPVALVDEE